MDDRSYKASNYNVFGRVGEKWILANTFTSAITTLNDEGKAAAQYLLDNPAEIVRYKDHELGRLLIENRYVIEEDFSELEFLKETHFIAKEGTDSLGLAITTTMQCNLRCGYCYEYDRLGPNHLSEKLEASVLALLERELPKKKLLHVVWWGGEPLLRPQTIERLSLRMIEACKKHNVRYLASITTNGALLSESNAKMLQKFFVKRVQITLDGNRESHDQRRVTVKGKGSFSNIIENLRANARYFENIILRINVNNRNCDTAFDLFSELEEVKGNIFLAPRPANDPHATTRPDWLMTLAEFVDFEDKFNRASFEKGFRIVVGYSDAGLTYCNAYQSKNSFSIDPYGGVHICPIFTGDKENRFGELDQDGVIAVAPSLANKESQLTTTEYPFSDPGCVKCPALPVCMGGCVLYEGGDRPGMGDLRCIAKHNIAEKMYLTRSWDFTTKKAEQIS